VKYYFFYIALCILVLVFPVYGNSGLSDGASRSRQVYVENKGQWNREALFLASSPGLDVWLTRTGIVYDSYEYTDKAGTDKKARRRGAVVRMDFLRAQLDVRFEGDSPQATTHNYFRAGKTITDVNVYERARAQQLYEGIDAVFYFDNGLPRYDILVQPKADYKKIAFTFQGARSVAVTPEGNLAITTDNGVLEQRGLLAYQINGNGIDTIGSRFVIHTAASGESVVAFTLDGYDSSRPLVIDPLIYSSFLGGEGNEKIEDVAVDQGGSAYVLGTTTSVDFPVTVGTYDTTLGSTDIFITKYDYSGINIVFSTFIGGSGDETAKGLVRDNFGYLYVTGETSSMDFPEVRYTYPASLPGGNNVFVLCLSGLGNAMRYVTLLGGKENEWSEGIAVDKRENVYVTGTTMSSDFPVYRHTDSYKGGEDAFLFSLNNNGQWRFSELLGGLDNDHGKAITVDALDAVWVAGETRSADLPQTNSSTYRGDDYNVFFAKWDTNGNRNIVGYIGSAAGFSTAITSDKSGNVYIAGYTPDAVFNLPDSPIQPQYDKQYGGGIDGFLFSLAPSGDARYSTLLGAGYDDIPLGLTIDAHNNLIIVGLTNQSGAVDDFLPNAYYSRYSKQEGFIAVLKPGNANFSYSTYLGGSNNDECTAVAVGADSTIYVVGNTLSPDFPITVGTREYKAGWEGFVARLQYIPKLVIPSEPLVIDFGDVYIGDSRRGSVTLRNRGESSAEITSYTIRNGTQFSVQTSVPATIPAGDFSFECTFTPKTLGNASDEVTLHFRFLSETIRVVLKGRGVEMPPPVVDVQPDTLNFGDVQTSLSKSDIIMVTNVGVVPVTISSIFLSNVDDFSLSSDPVVPFILLPAQSRSFTVTFTPSTPGEVIASVHIGVARMTTALVSYVRGNGVPAPVPVLSVPDSYDFGRVQIGGSKEWNPSIYNSGRTSATLSVEQPAVQVFAVTMGTLLVEPNASVNMTVSFTPVSAASTNTIVRIPVRELTVPIAVEVKGEGVFPQVTAATIDFGEVGVNETSTATTAVQNIGIDTLRMLSLVSNGSIFTVPPVGATMIAVGETLPVEISFTPDRIGDFTELIWVTVDYLPDPLPIVVKGKGVINDVPLPRITVDRDTLDFGEMAVQTSTTASFIISNLSTTQSVQVTRLEFRANSAPDFSFQNPPDIPFTIEAGGSYPITVQFRPDAVGETSAIISVRSTASSLTVFVVGNGKDDPPPPVIDTVTIGIAGRKVVIGQEFDIIAACTQPAEIVSMLSERGITGIRAVLKWNASVLFPLGTNTRTVTSGSCNVVVETPLSVSADGVLFRLPVKTLLGNADFTDVEITEWQWLPGSADTSRLYTAYQDTCRIKVTDVWFDDDGPRLVNPFAGVLQLDIAPNPFTDKATIKITPMEGVRTVQIYDMLGTLVLDLTDRLQDAGSVDMTASELPSAGIYYCRFTTGSSVLVRTIILR
jgi:hypothetical protein